MDNPNQVLENIAGAKNASAEVVENPPQQTLGATTEIEIATVLQETTSVPAEFQTEVGSMEPALKTLLGQLKERLSSNEYYLLLGDDTSGRLPSLTLKKVIDHINATKDRQAIPLAYVQAGRYMPHEKVYARIKDILQRFQPSTPNQKILIITDFISA